MRFVLIQRPKTDTNEWEVADEDNFNDVLNNVMTTLSIIKSNASKAFAWSDAKRGIIALKACSKARLEEFRQAIREWAPEDDEEDQGLEFKTYLIEAVSNKFSLGK